jgi:hypothetical protein
MIRLQKFAYVAAGMLAMALLMDCGGTRGGYDAGWEPSVRDYGPVSNIEEIKAEIHQKRRWQVIEETLADHERRLSLLEKASAHAF